MIKIPPKTEYVIEQLEKNGFEAYIVGGCVRDMLLGLEPFDFDVTTSAKPEQIMELFHKTVPTGIKHGTVTVIIDKEPIEVTTFRTESGYSDSRHPENVEFVTSLAEDLSRRDFTVNAIAYNNRSGIIDCFGSMRDLESKTLRAVGAPSKRFSEDALRILRLFRFAATLNFSIDERTLDAALNQSGGLKNISRERIAAELKKAVMGQNIKAISPLIESGALGFLGLNGCPDFSKLEILNKKPMLSLFAFLYFADCDVVTVLDELKESNSNKKYAADMLKLLKLDTPKTKTDLKLLLGDFSYETLTDYIEFKKNLTNENLNHLKDLLNEIISNNEPYLISHLNINGEELKGFGISGRKIGETLELLKNFVINNPESNTKERLLEFLNQR